MECYAEKCRLLTSRETPINEYEVALESAVNYGATQSTSKLTAHLQRNHGVLYRGNLKRSLEAEDKEGKKQKKIGEYPSKPPCTENIYMSKIIKWLTRSYLLRNILIP